MPAQHGLHHSAQAAEIKSSSQKQQAPIQLYFCCKGKKKTCWHKIPIQRYSTQLSLGGCTELCKYPLRVTPCLLLCEGFERKRIFPAVTRGRGPSDGTQEDKDGLRGPFVQAGATVCPLTSFPEPPAPHRSTLSVSYDCRLKAFILKLFKNVSNLSV